MTATRTGRIFAALDPTAQLAILEDAAEQIEHEGRLELQRAQLRVADLMRALGPNGQPGPDLTLRAEGLEPPELPAAETPEPAEQPDTTPDPGDGDDEPIDAPRTDPTRGTGMGPFAPDELERDDPDACDDVDAAPAPPSEPDSEPPRTPAPQAEDSPPDPPAPARRKRETLPQEILERHATVLLDERRATPNAIATAAGRDWADQRDASFAGPAPTVVRRAEQLLGNLKSAGRIEAAGKRGKGTVYGWARLIPPRPEVAAREPEDPHETLRREIRGALVHGPSFIPHIAQKHDRPPAEVAQAMQLMVRDGLVTKVPGGAYELIDQQ